MAEWVYSNDFPNWSTLIVEIGIGVGIALYLFYLQSKTNESNKAVISKINEATQKIDSYVEEKKKLEAARTKYYTENLRKDLEYIKYQGLELFDIIMEFQHYDRYPSRDIWFWIHMQRFQISEKT